MSSNLILPLVTNSGLNVNPRRFRDFMAKKAWVIAVSLVLASLVSEAFMRLTIAALNSSVVLASSNSVRWAVLIMGIGFALFFGCATFVLVYRQIKRRLRED